jgi:hypothetical protein
MMADFVQKLDALVAEADAFAAPHLTSFRAAMVQADEALTALRSAGFSVQELSRMSAEGFAATRLKVALHRELRSK